MNLPRHVKMGDFIKLPVRLSASSSSLRLDYTVNLNTGQTLLSTRALSLESVINSVLVLHMTTRFVLVRACPPVLKFIIIN